MAWTLDGNTIQEPSSFEIEHIKIQAERRLANGTLKKDVRAKKKELRLSYKFLRWSQLEIFWNVFSSATEFVTFSYMDQGTQKSATVEMSSLPTRLSRTAAVAENYLYTDVEIILREQ